MKQRMITRWSVPLYSTKSLCAVCLAGMVLGVIIGALLTVAGHQYHKRTSNPLLLGWAVASDDQTFADAGDEVPAELDFSEDRVSVTTKTGARFESPYEVNASDTELGKSITIHDYLGEEGRDVTVSWSLQPVAHIVYRTDGGKAAFGISNDREDDQAHIDYVFCG